MKILFLSQNPLSKELGAPKIMLELAEELQQLGWDCKIASPSDIMPGKRRFDLGSFSESLRDYLIKYAPEYDVVEYEHVFLPYSRNEFCSRTLFACRVTLLCYHIINLSIPLMRNYYQSGLHSFLLGGIDRFRNHRIMRRANITLRESDIINVANHNDKTELIRRGTPKEKIVIIPYGISRARRPLFDSVSSRPPEKPLIVFLGAFGIRKGAMDLPFIFQNIYDNIPQIKFKLLGTGGDSGTVLAKFPQRLRGLIEVIPNFLSDDLPGLLSDCSAGIFPSYAESFGFGVLEMLAASVPVIAYDAPGPSMMLPQEYLVNRGDTREMSLKVIALLKDKMKLESARKWAKNKSGEFSWQQAAQDTSRIYIESWKRKQEFTLNQK
jgi:glycosyltransferase involved in cell wall biosynthesis